MQLFDPKNPNEKKKMIAAAALGLAAILVLGYMFWGGSSKPANTNRRSTPTPTPPGRGTQIDDTATVDDTANFQEIKYNGPGAAGAEADRNIFSYYEPPLPIQKPPPTPAPIPTPPLTLSSLSPQSVYARTGDFSLQVMGDKFTAGMNIAVDNRVVQTRYLSAQQLATTITADMIANPGSRSIMVKNADGSVYSNSISLAVTPPPVPNYSYVGFIGKPRYNDMGVLQDKSSKDFLNVQRGDVVGGRFRVNSISNKEVVLIDNNLKIRHTITFSSESNPGARPPVRRAVVDDEPEL